MFILSTKTINEYSMEYSEILDTSAIFQAIRSCTNHTPHSALRSAIESDFMRSNGCP